MRSLLLLLFFNVVAMAQDPGVVVTWDNLSEFGSSPRGVTAGADAAVYGISTKDGADVLWRYDAAKNLVKLAAFGATSPVGDKVIGSLVVDSTQAVYGVTSSGGPNKKGTVWKWTEAAGLIKVAALGTAAIPGVPSGAIARDFAGNLFGVSESSVTTPYLKVTTVLWKVTPSGVLSALATLNDNLTGHDVKTVLVQGDVVYGLSCEGSFEQNGALWRWSPSSGLELLTAFPKNLPVGTGDGRMPLTGRFVRHSSGKFMGVIIEPIYREQEIWSWSPSDGFEVESGPRNFDFDVDQPTSTVFDLSPDGTIYGIGTWQKTPDMMSQLWRIKVGDDGAMQDSELLYTAFAQDLVSTHPKGGEHLAFTSDNVLWGVSDSALWRLALGAAAEGALPSATTAGAIDVNGTHAITQGTVNPNGGDTTARIEYGLAANALTSWAVAQGDSLTGTTAVNVSIALTGLQPSTTYYYRVAAQNVVGTARGSVLSLRTLPVSNPTISTQAATAITATGADLAALVDPKGYPTTVTFDFGLTTAYGQTVTVPGAALTGSGAIPVTAFVGGLLPHTTYHFRARAMGDRGYATGADRTFKTGNRPPISVGGLGVVVVGGPSPFGYYGVMPGGTYTLDLDVVYSSTPDPDGDEVHFGSVGKVASSDGKVSVAGRKLIFTASATLMHDVTLTYTLADDFGGVSRPITWIVALAETTLDHSTAEVNAAGGVETIKLTTWAKPAVIESLSWVSVAPLDLASPRSIDLIIAPNTTLNDRQGSVFIGGTEFFITQHGIIQGLAPDFDFGDYPSTIVHEAYHASVPIKDGPATVSLVKGRLPSGLTLHSDGSITGRTTTVGSYSFDLKVSNVGGSTIKTFGIDVAALPDWLLGDWIAGVVRDPTLNNNLGSSIRVNVSASGVISGTLNTGGSSLPFVTYLGDGMVGDPPPSPAALATVRRSGKPSLFVKLGFSAAGLSGETPSLDGYVSLVANPGEGDFAAVWGGREKFSRSLPADGFTGSYVAKMEVAGVPDDGYPVPPQGVGYMTMNVSSSGAATFGGKLPDGTSITGSSAILDQSAGTIGGLYLPIYFPVNNGLGSLVGDLEVDAGGEGYLSTISEVAVDWLKLPQSTRAYSRGILKNKDANGFMNGLAMTIRGHWWQKPAVGENVLLVAVAPNNVVFDATGGGIEQTSRAANLVTRLFTLNAASVADFGPVASNPAQISLKIVPSTGLWTGQFTLLDVGPFGPVTRVVKSEGVIILGDETTESEKGIGFFLLPKLRSDAEHPVASPNPATNTTMLSGRVRFMLPAAPGP